MTVQAIHSLLKTRLRKSTWFSYFKYRSCSLVGLLVYNPSNLLPDQISFGLPSDFQSTTSCQSFSVCRSSISHQRIPYFEDWSLFEDIAQSWLSNTFSPSPLRLFSEWSQHRLYSLLILDLVVYLYFDLNFHFPGPTKDPSGIKTQLITSCQKYSCIPTQQLSHQSTKGDSPLPVLFKWRYGQYPFG